MFRMMRDKEYATAKEAIMARVKRKSEFLSAFGIAFQVFKALTDEVLNFGGSDQDIRRIETDSQLRRKIAKLIVQPIEKLAENCYRVVVDYGQTLQQMIANGGYDDTDSDINSDNFPMTGPSTSTSSQDSAPRGSGQATKQDVVIEIVSFKGTMKSEAVLKDFKARGLRAAILPELLAFGATYPEKQRGLPVIALGSSWQHRSGYRDVPYLDGDGSGRELNLGWYGSEWYDGCRFAAVRLSTELKTGKS